MKSIRSLWKKPGQEVLNGYCIMLEGLFNTLGHDLIGMNTIVPLFLAHLGASMEAIGSLSTLQSVFGAIMPLLCGGFVAAAASKKRMSMAINGVARTAFLLIPLGIVLGLSPMAELALFFGVMILSGMGQPVTGITWNYLLGDCVPPERRGKLLGTLYALSGVITFVSSALIKAIRSSPALSEDSQYAAIFALGGALMACSVLCYIPLRERTVGGAPREQRNPRRYIHQLISCYRNGLFRGALVANVFSSMALSVNAFFFVFAQNTLMLSTDQVSNLIVIQTLGLMIGGVVTGRISERLGIKRMLQTIEGLGILVPVMGLAAMGAGAPFVFAALAVFIIGFTKSGLIGYQAYILEIIPTEESVYHIVARSLTLLPFSFTGIAVGGLIARFSNTPAFILQIALGALAFAAASRLKLTVYKKKNAAAQAAR